ncbi:MAG: bifunctional tetrahydrofolate synthase/dihydrofolate synthase [Gammaproteobacteria bacterium]|nr:bifunctional tetrahydrofolate synthase/dihydrofolate synthase [Gammaproteobacteria bacterium]
MQLPDWLAFQQAQHSDAIALGIDRVRDVANRLGLLAFKYPSIIVGGTNGKGSTVAFLTALCRAAGLRTGTYTSPHLQRYNERITINGQPVDDATLLRAFERIEQARGDTPLTFFEYGTLAAFLIFDEGAVRAAVIEVGLGGRLDATNIIDADVAVLCSVGLDHQDWLGPTVEDIGREKAGVFRERRPVILGSSEMPRSVHDAVERLRCHVSQLDQDFFFERVGKGFCWRSKDRAFESLPLPALQGPIQLRNAATAIAAFTAWHRVCPTPDRELIARGLATAELRGRFQRIAPTQAEDPEWILDVAHNEDSARVLAEALKVSSSGGKTFGVVGILQNKDAGTIGESLVGVIDEWVLCGLVGPRGSSAEELRSRLPARCRSIALAPDVSHGCATARALARRGDRIVVFGSFHVVGPALDWLGL